jgi:hypothetical protein
LGTIVCSNHWSDKSKVDYETLQSKQISLNLLSMWMGCWLFFPTLLINFSGNECGPFRAIEESTIAQISPTDKRGDIYAWYSLLGACGSAFGMGSSGWLLNFLLKRRGWDTIKAYRTVFWVYSALGIVLLCLVLILSKACEVERKSIIHDLEAAGMESEAGEPKKPSPFWQLKLPQFSPASKVVVIKLCLLFALDSFACGLTPLYVSFPNTTSTLTLVAPG